MTRPKNLVAAVLALLGALRAGAAAQGPSSAEVATRQTAMARVARAMAMAADPDVVKAVLAKNAEGERPEEVQERDRRWSRDKNDPLRLALTRSPCAQRLRELVKDDPIVAEVILMDNQGANVCVSAGASDYWQGDEPKWQRTFKEGMSPFVDSPAFDASSGAYAIQLSVPVSANKERIGALTLTLKVRLLGTEPSK